MYKIEEAIIEATNQEDIKKKTVIKAYRIPMIGGLMHYGVASELTTPTPTADASVAV